MTEPKGFSATCDTCGFCHGDDLYCRKHGIEIEPGQHYCTKLKRVITIEPRRVQCETFQNYLDHVTN